jgi:hypothetical protein
MMRVMAKFYLATIGLLAAALLGTAGAGFLEPLAMEPASMACEEELEEAREEAIEQYRDELRSCLDEASTLEEAKECLEM